MIQEDKSDNMKSQFKESTSVFDSIGGANTAAAEQWKNTDGTEQPG